MENRIKTTAPITPTPMHDYQNRIIEKTVPAFSKSKGDLSGIFQKTLNDLNQKEYSENNRTIFAEPLKEDGIVGPKTAEAFKKVFVYREPGDFTKNLEGNLGLSGSAKKSQSGWL